MSDYNVIASGRSKLKSLQEKLYLHNIEDNYIEIGGPFSSVDISIMDRIGVRMIQQQRTREEYIYDLLGVKNIDEFNMEYLRAGGNSDFINSNINDILSEATSLAFDDLTGVYRNKSNEQNISSAFDAVVNEMIDEEYKDNKVIMEKLKEGLSPNVAKMLADLRSSKGKPRKMDKYIEKMANQIGAKWREEVLEQETGAVMQELVEKITGKRGNVTITAKTINGYGKQIKSDVNLQLTDHLQTGISVKNYQLDSKGNVEVSLHSSGKLENFYKLVNEMMINGATAKDFMGIKNIINSFGTPYFKYHLINQAAFAGTKRIGGTEVGENIIRFVKTCLPLFIGAQLKIMGDDINVDFFNISGKLVPVSTIMESVFNGGSLVSLNIGLYSNYEIPWVTMREKKMQFPVRNGEFYSDETQQIGSIYGQKLYDNINIGTIHLKVALSKFK